ncbi:hypothetical protein [Defluviimonas salinarum]|uniref:Uncharacterized protein n=1 Tax=Defluviimonas salinarum TaxID=2992147 RepID=A0ABT3J9T1_9RHOB|nr:hypothetical protein [Defluviimonas salinarum]MCW3784293.1 hypothetical protein [Defluviimonas salinarum]
MKAIKTTLALILCCAALPAVAAGIGATPTKVSIVATKSTEAGDFQAAAEEFKAQIKDRREAKKADLKAKHDTRKAVRKAKKDARKALQEARQLAKKAKGHRPVEAPADTTTPALDEVTSGIVTTEDPVAPEVTIPDGWTDPILDGVVSN